VVEGDGRHPRLMLAPYRLSAKALELDDQLFALRRGPISGPSRRSSRRGTGIGAPGLARV
jgi:hypothetical protein